MTVVAADPAAGRIQLSTSMSMLTWGENLVVGVRSMSPDSTEVSVHSALKFGLVDWGRNRENIGNLFQRIAAAVNAPAGAWHPDPSGRHELRWWDGNGWTQNVSDRGQFGTDVL